MKISKKFSSIILIACLLCYLVESESIIHQIYGIKRTDGVVLKQLTSELKSFILQNGYGSWLKKWLIKPTPGNSARKYDNSIMNIIAEYNRFIINQRSRAKSVKIANK
jgi:hypothetical protein